MVIFGLKQWVNPFGKMAIFDFLNFLFFQVSKACFRSRISSKTFSCRIKPKKNLEKWPFLDHKHGLTFLEKMSIFRLFELLVFIAQNGVFVVLEYRKRHFPGLYCLKNIWKNGHFSSKTVGYPVRKNVNFSTF